MIELIEDESIANRTHHVIAQVGDTVLLPCPIPDLGSSAPIWRKDVTVLTIGHFAFTADPRISCQFAGINWDLEIKNVTERDGGHYECSYSQASTCASDVYLEIA